MSTNSNRHHTPGPWKADPKRLMIQTAHGMVEGPIMSYLAGNKGTAPGMTVSVASERHADHYLCAAAPELLFALQLLHDNLAEYQKINNLGGYDNHDMRMAREAIAKATEFS